ARELGIGTSIVTRAGPSVRVASITRHEAPAPVYNFEVEGTHSYFVGLLGQGLCVHHECGRAPFAGVSIKKQSWHLPFSAARLGKTLLDPNDLLFLNRGAPASA
ncbi:MAG TPA: Hint domain-containing protein, partial [Armatimonadota bacterium]